MKIRKHTASKEDHWLGDENMGQARTLSERELKLLLLYIATRKFSSRDRAMMLLTHWGGMRIGEVAATQIGDVLSLDGTIKSEIRLSASQTKGKHARTVILSEKLRKELQTYLQQRFETKQLVDVTYKADMTKPLFATQKKPNGGFSANTACYHFHMLYRSAGLDGASSHSGRRSFLTQLSAKAVPLKVMMELAGHRQAQTTMRYISVTTDMKKAAVNLV